MSAAALFSELRAAGVTLAANGDRLKIKAAPGIITPELTARLKTFKPELLAFLANDPTANDETTPAPDLPLLAAVIEFQALIDRLCLFRGHTETVRGELHAALNGKAPERVIPELVEMREHVARVEQETRRGDRKA